MWARRLEGDGEASTRHARDDKGGGGGLSQMFVLYSKNNTLASALHRPFRVCSLVLSDVYLKTVDSPWPRGSATQPDSLKLTRISLSGSVAGNRLVIKFVVTNCTCNVVCDPSPSY